MKGPVVVIDATDKLGRGIVEAALHQQWPTVAVSANASELKTLRERHAGADLVTLTGSTRDETSSAALAAALRELDRPIAGIVIAGAGEPLRGRVLDHPARELLSRIDADLLPQIAAARQLLPLLAASGRNGSYVVVGSPGGEHPWAGYGARSVAAAAVTMLTRVLHDEARAFGVRVQLLTLSRPVRTDENRACACDGWPSAAAIGEQALALIEQTDSRKSTEAVVRFTSPARVNVSKTTQPDEPASPSSAASSVGQLDSGSQHVLDQTWHALEPIFNSIRENDERK
jgi:NAD(P)-dependent dehydrogenase (short-subunit alcohol dehydrogenase family)